VRGVEPELQTSWDWRAAANFIGGGAGAGLFLFTALAAQQDASWLGRVGLFAPLLVLLGLAGVGSELGRPLRALNVFRRPHTSWMSREALAAAAFLPAAFAAFALRLPALALFGASLGIALVYCQARMLRAAKGIAAWREPAIVPLIIATGIVEGAALFVALGLVLGTVPDWALATLAWLITLRLFVWQAYRSRLARPGAAPRRTVEILDETNRPLEIAGHFLPLGLLLLALLTPAGTIVPALVGAVLAVAAGWYLKLALVTRVAYDQGFAVARAPARTPGYSHPGGKPGWT
jgi:phenylacetyl-CoA:acceptor oxidoreductase 26-kDa subunit